MRSVVPSESATVPLPDHDPLKPVNGPDWAWLTDTDNMSAAPTPAALIACPNNLEPNNFISNFPIQMTFLYKPGLYSCHSQHVCDLVAIGGLAGGMTSSSGSVAELRITSISPVEKPVRVGSISTSSDASSP